MGDLTDWLIGRKSGRGLPHSRTLRAFGYNRSRASVLDCGSPLPLFHWNNRFLLHFQPRRQHRQAHARTKNTLAARAYAPAFRSGNLLCNRLDLSKDASFSRRETASGFTSWLADRGRQVWLAIGSVGGVFKSLPFRRPLARRCRRRFQLERYVEPVACQDGGVGQQTRQVAGSAGLVQFP